LAETRLKIAVFIDFDNIEIGVKTTLGGHFDVGAVLEAIKERGEVVTKVAYGDWTRAGDYSRSLTQHAIHMVQRNLTPGGDKNGADINLALDALEMAFTHSHINAFVIVGGDSDFMALVEKLKQYDRKVFVVGGRAFTSTILQKNCTEFIAYENLVGSSARSKFGRGGKAAGEAGAEKAVPLIRRALKVLADREVSPQLGVLKSTLLQLDSTFSEREYGASTFRDFVQRLARGGYVSLKGTDRNIYVELRDGSDGGTPATAAAAALAAHRDGETSAALEGETGGQHVPALDPETTVGTVSESAVATSGSSVAASQPASSTPASSTPASSTTGQSEVAQAPPAAAASAPFTSSRQASRENIGNVAPVGGGNVGGNVGGGSAPIVATAQQTELLRLALDVFQKPGAVGRWPLYLRQVKQLLRTADESFDERRYGFSGIVEALRYCQREGLFRLDRDRQGVLRVYPGPVLQRTATSSPQGDGEQADGHASSQETHGGEPAPMDLFPATETVDSASAAADSDVQATPAANTDSVTSAAVKGSAVPDAMPAPAPTKAKPRKRTGAAVKTVKKTAAKSTAPTRASKTTRGGRKSAK
jgi:uncharacterized LabA/DUF88 family protein